MMRLIYAGLGVMLVVALRGQSPSRPEFEAPSVALGLTHATVNTILQDHEGFLWLGTWSGLMKYDGYRVQHFNQGGNGEHSLHSNQITTLFEDSRRRLWIGSQNSGLHRFDRSKQGFDAFPPTAGLSDDYVLSIAEDTRGAIWVGTDNGLNRLDPTTDQIHAFSAEELPLASSSVYSLLCLPDGEVWLGTKLGVSRIFLKDGRYHSTNYLLADPIPSSSEEEHELRNFVYTIFPDPCVANVLWVGGKGGLYRLRYFTDHDRKPVIRHYAHKPENAHSLSHNFVTDIAAAPNDQLWIATYNGLNLLDPVSGRFQHFISRANDPGLLSNNTIRSLFVDRAGILWIGTDKGINMLRPDGRPFHHFRFNHADNPNNNVVTRLRPTADGRGIWVGTRNGGLNYLPAAALDRNEPQLAVNYSLQTPRFPALANFITDLLPAPDGGIWISTQGAGVLYIRESDLPKGGGRVRVRQQLNKGETNRHTSDDYPNGLLLAASGDLWIATWDGGLNRYDPETGIVHHYRMTADNQLDLTAFPNIHLLETTENDRRYLWVGTRGNGLYQLRYDESRDELRLVRHHYHRPDDPNSLSNNLVNRLYLDSLGRLLIGTEGGLNIYHPPTTSFSKVTAADGLPTQIIQSLEVDEHGRIWLSTNRGLSSIFWPADSPRVQSYDLADGLNDNYFYDNSSCRTPSGYLAFGGDDGISYFRPNEPRREPSPPNVVLTDLRLFNQAVTIGPDSTGRTVLASHISRLDELVLNYRQNVISIEFVGLDLTAAHRLRYAYKLDGFDNDWIYTSADQRLAHYTNLPYDTYTFLVKAANSQGSWGEPTRLSLTIRPPLWRTPWAYLAYALLFLCLLYGVRAITLMRANLRNKLKLEQVERHKLEELNQLKIQFFTNISHELRTPLTLVISPLEQLIRDYEGGKKLHQTFVRMHHNANRLLTMINQLLDLRKSEAGLLKLAVAEGNIVKFLQEVIASFRGLAEQRRIQLLFEPADDHILLWFDRDQMEKVIFNLLSNAFKYTPDEGTIRLWVGQAGNDKVEITIEDSGPGVDPEKLPFIFNRFYQADNPGSLLARQGTGIGLALARDIVEKHQGVISVHNRTKGGACFRLALPTGDEHFSAEEKITDFRSSDHPSHYVLPNVSEENVQLSHVDDSNSRETPNGKALPAGERTRLLIVEDNVDIRAYLRDNLSDVYLIEEAGDGVEALEKALHQPPDLIISDIAMPRMDGIEFCRRVKTERATSHIPVILLTARTSLIFKLDGYENGADDYVTKPFNMKLLAARISNLIEIRRKLRERFARQFEVSPSDVTINSLDATFLQQAIACVEENMENSEFTVNDLAHALFLSRMQLYRKLKALTGHTPNSFIRHIRLKRAARLLEANHYTVAEVTYKVGFQDLKYFREKFRKEFGVTPSDYAAAFVKERTEQE